jgi:hypothetical protein
MVVGDSLDARDRSNLRTEGERQRSAEHLRHRHEPMGRPLTLPGRVQRRGQTAEQPEERECGEHRHQRERRAQRPPMQLRPQQVRPAHRPGSPATAPAVRR